VFVLSCSDSPVCGASILDQGWAGDGYGFVSPPTAMSNTGYGTLYANQQRDVNFFEMVFFAGGLPHYSWSESIASGGAPGTFGPAHVGVFR
jgi:hypothetical protein